MSKEQRSLQNIDAVQQHWERFRKYMCPRVPSVERLMSTDFLDSAPPELDMIEIVLKGHLLIEEILTGIVADAVGLSQLPSRAGEALLFFQKLALTKRIVAAEVPEGSQVSSNVWSMIEELNTFRNRLSHRIHQELDLSSGVSKIAEAYERGTSDSELGKTPGIESSRLLRALWHVYNLLTFGRMALQQQRLNKLKE